MFSFGNIWQQATKLLTRLHWQDSGIEAESAQITDCAQQVVNCYMNFMFVSRNRILASYITFQSKIFLYHYKIVIKLHVTSDWLIYLHTLNIIFKIEFSVCTLQIIVFYQVEWVYFL